MLIPKEKEIWKKIVIWRMGQEYTFSKYRVSNLGRVKSLKKGRGSKSKILKQNNSNCFQAVNLYADSKAHVFYVHLLVLNTFVGRQQQGEESCFLNKKKCDCKLNNLKWIVKTRSGGTKTTTKEIIQIKDLLCDSIKPSIIAHYVGCKIFNVSYARHDKYQLYKNVPWPNKSRNFWKKPNLIKMGLKSKVCIGKLTEDDIIQIKEYLYIGNPSQAEISRMYNVSEGLITKIKKGERWSNVGRKLSF